MYNLNIASNYLRSQKVDKSDINAVHASMGLSVTSSIEPNEDKRLQYTPHNLVYCCLNLNLAKGSQIICLSDVTVSELKMGQ